jgi:hypothetical protein
MMVRKLLALMAVMMLAGGLFTSPALAKKKCKRLCKDNIAACKEATCQPLPNHRRKCNLTCKRDAITLCKSRPETTTCSPSGAFLDQSTF